MVSIEDTGTEDYHIDDGSEDDIHKVNVSEYDHKNNEDEDNLQE